MTLDIRGGIKNTKISQNSFTVFEELLSNSIDSYLIRKNSDEYCPKLDIHIKIEYLDGLLRDGSQSVRLTCTDNGAGFGDGPVKAFVTKDSTYKDSLSITGIGKCKGTGRIQFFHYFNHLKIDSTFIVNGSIKHRSLIISENTKEVSEQDFKIADSASSELQTVVSLAELKPKLKLDFSSQDIRDYLFLTFLQRFIFLKKVIGDFKIDITEVRTQGEEQVENTLSIDSKDLPEPTDEQQIVVLTSNETRILLKVTRYSIPANELSKGQHEVALCANYTIVMSIIKDFIKKADRTSPLYGNFELLFVESEVLETTVNVQRDGFDLPLNKSPVESFNDDISLEEIIEALKDYVYSILTPKDFDKEELITATQEKFGITRGMLNTMNIKVHYGDTEGNIAKRVLRRFQEEIVNETSNLVDLKQEVLKLDPRSQDFRDKVQELSWEYTSSIKKMDMANLSQLVVRRATILEILKLAVKSSLNCQNESGVRNENERVIHNIFFPMGKDSNEFQDHDIWILNEEYHYFSHIASDKSLASITLPNSEKLFDSDIDASLEKLFAQNNEEHKLKRPDIAIFNEEGAAIIIEFKAPGVPIQEHLNDLTQYARLLAAKSKGKLRKFYGYIIGDTIDPSRIPGNYTPFPSGLGYFTSSPLTDPVSRIPYGELYSEVLLYSQFIDKAENRLKVYKEKLNFDIN
ncbi:hypothetical protein Q9292_09075 [Methylophilus sp. VKM B-3414]|uniref:hypothetical protein n=1 Tax=Methylophilus sp. VKM B-3414 TaxID=3076121 RepID=UPI0028C68E07|nr:hypothetical protein [Methylophilus sp. VKM B-3414]MDT7849761.1 hypothetical protein [Methylophilus sp. VKM B-3414]